VPRRAHRISVDDLLPTALLFLFLGTFLFTWLDWKMRVRKMGGLVDSSWDCPGCGLVNEAEMSVCWSCDAAITGRGPFAGLGPSSVETWKCRRCGAWNGTARRSCWSCASTPSKQPKRQV